jgi:hypothetical protein
MLVSWFRAPSRQRGWVRNLLVQLVLGLARAVALGSNSSRKHGHILLPHMKLPKPGGPVSRIYTSQEQGGSIIPRVLSSLSVTSHDSQGYGGSILTRLHKGIGEGVGQWMRDLFLTDPTEYLPPHLKPETHSVSVTLCSYVFLKISNDERSPRT